MQATPPFLGARVLAPCGGERAGPLLGRLTWPQVGGLTILGGPTFVVRRTIFFLRMY